MQEALKELVKPSIFDEEFSSSMTSSLWENEEYYKKNYKNCCMSTEILYSGMLIHQDDLDQMTELTVDLYEDRLIAYSNKAKISIFGIIPLNVRLEYTEIENREEDEIQFLFFQKNSRYTALFCLSEKKFEQWIENLKPLCILANFFSEYKFEKVIGQGAFAKVFMSSRVSDNQKFAVKVFNKPNIKNKKNQKPEIIAIRNEVNILRQINHPNIIKAYEIYEGQKHVYIVMDLLTGGELFKKLYDEVDITE